MKGNMKVWIVVAWVWWTAVFGAAFEEDQHTLGYKEVSFCTVNATEDSYKQFTVALREQLASSDERHAIPVLREPSTVLDSERFVLVSLSNWDEDNVTLAIDVTNAYVVAYRAGDQSYFFLDAPESALSNLFSDTNQTRRNFTGSYTDLQRIADRSREEIALGITALHLALSSLHRSDMQDQARSLIVLIQMVSEAARFRYIERLVHRSITNDGYDPFFPNAAMLSFENKWSTLSKAIQNSNKGVFSSPVQLQRPNHSTFNVSRVNPILIRWLGIMLFICRDRASEFCLLRRSVVADDHDDICVVPEPTVRISGQNGLCVDVRDGKYDNGNPIQLWKCKDQLEVNQLWTLKRDGTIRSNGKCLTTFGYWPGCNVMIYDCPTPVTGASRWEVWDNGTIVNSKSALVLSANSGNSGTNLTVETNIYASGQGWAAGNDSEPFVTSIVGFIDICMQANRDASAMWLVECENSKAEQRWAIYADGSIRPHQNRDHCLTCNDQGNIIILSCGHGSVSQRWVFRNDGTILNLNNGMVMDVKQSDPSLHQIIIWPFTGNPNQMWLPMI